MQKVTFLQAQICKDVAKESLDLALKESAAALEAVQALSPRCPDKEREEAVARVASTQKELAQQKIESEKCGQQLQSAEAQAAVAARGMHHLSIACLIVSF
jgi:hypothetical protein